MWEMLPLKNRKKGTENRREESFSPVKPFSTTRKWLVGIVLAYAGLFFSNRLLQEPALYYSPLYRLMAALILLVGLALFVVVLRRRRLSPLIASGSLVLFVVLTLLHLRMMVFDVVRVSGPSMEPLLKEGDILLVERLSTGLHLPALDFPFSFFLSSEKDPGPPWSRTLFSQPPAAGDVIVYDYPERRSVGRFFIKRVVALPGQHYHFANHLLFIDGEPVRRADGTIAAIEPYPERHQNPVLDPPARFAELDVVFLYSAMNGIGEEGTVPPRGLLVIGDHYSESRDSRVIGFIPISAVQGRRWGDLVF